MCLLQTNGLLKIEEPQPIFEALYLLAADKGQAGLLGERQHAHLSESGLGAPQTSTQHFGALLKAAQRGEQLCKRTVRTSSGLWLLSSFIVS